FRGRSRSAPSPHPVPASATMRSPHRGWTTGPWKTSSSGGRRTPRRWPRSSSPGGGYCGITVDEVDEAIHGLTSRHAVIRRHAVCVLGERSLGAAVARRVLPLLCRTVSQDPDATVRRLAILSLLSWQKDSRRYADVVRQAL